MADEFRLSDDLAERITQLASDLASEAQELRDIWDEKSERWQDGEKGSEVDTWIDELVDLAESLDDLDKNK